jgi:outer membrane protein assembly factor BamB
MQTMEPDGEPEIGGEVVALDVRSGERAWRRAVTAELAPHLESGWFACPPLPCEGRLVVGLRAGRGGEEYHLCCLRAGDGVPVWRTFVSGRPSDPWYRYGRYQSWAEGMPAESEGLAVTCSGAGVIAAADLATGRLAWLSRYDQPTERRLRPRWYRRGISPGWRTPTPVISDGVVYATPPDSDFLYALDLDSGQLLWRHSRETHSHLAAARDGRVYLAGTRAQCLNASGEVEWQADLPTAVAGRPALGGHVLHLPLAGGILYLDAGTGGELAWTPWSDWKAAHGRTWSAEIASGDLLLAGGKLFAVTPYTLNVFEPLKGREPIEQALAANPDDPAAHYALGQEEQWQGDVAAAAKEIEKAIGLAAGQPAAFPETALADVRRRLATCYEDLARRHESAGRFDLAASACRAAIGQAAAGPARAGLRLRVAELCRRLRRWDDAVAAYQDVLAEADAGSAQWQTARSVVV